MSETKNNMVSEVKRKKPNIRNVNIEHKQSLKKIDRLALAITERVGSMGFFIVIFIWTASWLGWNTFAPKALSFDAFPGFVLWLFISNMIQIFLMPLIMIGQNIQSRHSEIRAEADFEINTKAELEIETILHHLEKQEELIIKILLFLFKAVSLFPPTLKYRNTVALRKCYTFE
jgi:uncharacterized membrane protein